MTHAYEYMNERINGAINPHNERFFHGRISREEAENRLLDDDPLDGLFLLRAHLHLDGYFVLSMCFRGHIKHYVIERQYNTGTVALEGSLRKFVGPVELVQGYSQHGQYQTSGLPCKLEQPCFITSGASPRSFTGLTQELMKEEMFGIAKSHGFSDQEIGSILNAFKRSEFEKLMRKFIHRNRDWYHGVISRKTAEKRLAKSGLQNGRFLVREKSKKCGKYSLSVCYKSLIYHYNIQRQTAIGQVSIEGGGYFDSMLALIDYYEMKKDNLACSLGEPCVRGDKSVTHKGSPGTVKLAEAFRAILSVGDIKPEDIAKVTMSLSPMIERKRVTMGTDQQIQHAQRPMSPGQRHRSMSPPRTPPATPTDISRSGYVNMQANVAVKNAHKVLSPTLHRRLVPLPSIDEDKDEDEEDEYSQEGKEEEQQDVFTSSGHIKAVFNRQSSVKYY